MNFGKKSTEHKQKSLSSSTRMLRERNGFSLIQVLFFSFITIAVITVCLGIGVIRGLVNSAPDISDVNIMPSGYATFVYDSNGTQLQKLTGSSSNRTSVSIDKIPEDMQHAIVAIEDERFYDHNGIDIYGIARAFTIGVSNGFHFSEGASTLTQQLLKNNVFTDWTQEGKMERFRRKFQEQYLAIQLEKSLISNGEDPKSVILENYLNTINLGAGTYGVQAASYRYFNKTVDQLTLSECAVLAAIPQNPTKFNPITHPLENSERRDKVLNNMLDQGYISQAEYDEALADNVYERIQDAEAAQEDPAPYSYFIDELIDQVINDLETKKGYTEVQAYNALYSGGLRIYTTQDPNIQAICDEEYADPDNFPSGSQVGIDWALSIKQADGETQHYSVEMMRLYFRNENPDFELLFDSETQAESYIDQYKAAIIKSGDTIIAERVNFSPQPQSSMTVMDQHTGFVKAIIGGRGEKTGSLTLNRATNTYRQPGSTFKVLSTYAPALDSGLTLATTYVDEPYEYTDEKRAVKNWLTNSYHGDTTIRYAIQESINVVAVKCFTDITPQAGFDYLEDFGFSRLVTSKIINGKEYSDLHQATALGGITYGVSNLELTAAYASLANGGVYTKPIFYTQILDQEGNVILENIPQTTTVIKESTAYLLTSALEDVVTKGTGTALKLDNMTVAGKTGTTSLYNDVWFAGYTPYYTCTVWSGYDNNEKLPPEDVYRSYHKTLWRKVMSRIHEGLSDPGFTPPDSVQEATICSQSGLLASSGCPTITEFFEKSTIPTERCTSHYSAPKSSSRSSDNGSDDSSYTAPQDTPAPTPENNADPGDNTTPEEENPQNTPTTDDTGQDGTDGDDDFWDGEDYEE